jgi:hypothetical protein
MFTTILRRHPAVRPVPRGQAVRCWWQIETWHLGATRPKVRRCSRRARWVVINGDRPEHRPHLCGQHAIGHLHETGRL